MLLWQNTLGLNFQYCYSAAELLHGLNLKIFKLKEKYFFYFKRNSKNDSENKMLSITFKK